MLLICRSSMVLLLLSCLDSGVCPRSFLVISIRGGCNRICGPIVYAPSVHNIGVCPGLLIKLNNVSRFPDLCKQAKQKMMLRILLTN